MPYTKWTFNSQTPKGRKQLLYLACDVFSDTVGCADPDECEKVCDIRSGCTNIAYPMLVLELMPTGKPTLTQLRETFISITGSSLYRQGYFNLPPGNVFFRLLADFRLSGVIFGPLSAWNHPKTLQSWPRKSHFSLINSLPEWTLTASNLKKWVPGHLISP